MADGLLSFHRALEAAQATRLSHDMSTLETIQRTAAEDMAPVRSQPLAVFFYMLEHHFKRTLALTPGTIIRERLAPEYLTLTALRAITLMGCFLC